MAYRARPTRVYGKPMNFARILGNRSGSARGERQDCGTRMERRARRGDPRGPGRLQGLTGDASTLPEAMHRSGHTLAGGRPMVQAPAVADGSSRTTKGAPMRFPPVTH